MTVKKARPFRPGFPAIGPLFLMRGRARRRIQTKRDREALYGRAIEWCARAIEGGAFVDPGSRSVEIPLESPEVA
jgi:hypothetical protein